MPPERPVRVLLVCLGNICRSPAAEGVFAALVREAGADRIVAASAGTHDFNVGLGADASVQGAARRRGVDLVEEGARGLLSHIVRAGLR